MSNILEKLKNVSQNPKIKSEWDKARVYGFLNSLDSNTLEFQILDIIIWEGFDNIDSLVNKYELPRGAIIEAINYLKESLSKTEAYTHFRVVPPQVEIKINTLQKLKSIIIQLADTAPTIEKEPLKPIKKPLQDIHNILKNISETTLKAVKGSNLLWHIEPNFEHVHFNKASKHIYKTNIQLDLLVGKELSLSPELSWINNISVKTQNIQGEKKMALAFKIEKKSNYPNEVIQELPIQTKIGKETRTIVLSPNKADGEFTLGKDGKQEVFFSSPLRHDIPLETLLRSIRKEMPSERYHIAKKFEEKFPHRIDFWLYRRLIIDTDLSELRFDGGLLHYQDEIQSVTVISKLLAGVTNKNDYIRTSCIATVARIRFSLLKLLFNESHAYNTLKLISGVLENPNTYKKLKVGIAESKLLAILCLNTSIFINDVISQEDTRSVKPKALLRMYQYVYDELNLLSVMMGLSEKSKMIFDRPMISALFVDLVLKERYSTSSNCIFWASEDYLPAIGFVLNNLCRENMKINTATLCSDDYESIKKLFIHIRRFQRLAWALVYSTRKNAINARSNRLYHGALVSIGRLEKDEQILLSDLAWTERALGNYINAAICSATVLFRLCNNNPQFTPQHIKKLKHIVSSAGLSIPYNEPVKKPYNNKIIQEDNHPKTEDVKKSTTNKPESLFDWGIINNPSVQFYVKRFSIYFDCEPLLFNIVSRIFHASRQPDIYSQKERGLLFEMALALGMVREAGFIALSKDSQILGLQKIPLLRYTNLLSEIYSKALPYIDHKIFHLLRGTILRKLWKTSTDELTSNEILKIHEVHHGMFHQAIENSDVEDSILWHLNRSNPSKIEIESYYDHLAKYIPKGFGEYLPHYNLDMKNLNICKDTAVVSLSIKDGHTLSSIVISNKKNRSFELSSKDYVNDNDKSEHLDWVNLVDDILGTQEIARKKEGETVVAWNESFRVIASNLITCINALNKDTKYVKLAVCDVLRGLPWQHLFSVEYNQKWLIEHIPNVSSLVHYKRPELDKDLKTRQTIHNSNDPVYALIHDEVLVNRKSMDSKVFPAYLNSVLTIFAQGEKNGSLSKLYVDDQLLSRSELDDLSGYILTIFHSCHSGHISDSPTGSIGGLPGFFLSRGSRMVIAPVGLVKPQTAKTFDGYITTWLKTRDKSFYEMYTQAIEENTDISFYSLFGSSRHIDELKQRK